jgi:hypothetical protein
MVIAALFYLSAALALIVALAGFLALGDVGQWVIVLPRAFTYSVFRVRVPLLVFGLGAFGVALTLGIAERLAPRWALGLYGAVCGGLFFGGFAVPTYVMFPTKQHTARYVPVAGVAGVLSDDEEVLAVEVDGDARAFPSAWMLRPHVAGDTVGGEPVVMTYCGLSHLGVAYRNELGGAPLDLKVMTQLENNLVLFDTATQEPIEQIYGRAVKRGAVVEQVPSVMMPLRTFRALYPQGTVFFNPPGGFLDRGVRGMMNGQLLAKGGQYDPANPRPVFPTIGHVDPRVPPKEQVYGVVRDGKAVAFTLDHLRRHGDVVTGRAGDSVITVKHFPDLGFVDVFEGDVREVDARGVLPGGARAKRVPHASRVLWLIWANFYRDTGVRT